MKLQTLKELFQHQLQDLYSAEGQIIKALPKIIDACSNADLKRVLTQHLDQTREHLDKIEEIGRMSDSTVKGVTCRGMEGIIAEGEEIISMIDDADVKDAAIIMAAQRVEHYNIAGYGTLAAHANELRLDEVADMCVELNAHEYEIDSNLTDIAEGRINAEANESGDSKL